MHTVYKWRVYCITESIWVESYNDSETIGPITCSNNTAHTINLNSISLIDKTSSNDVRIIEEENPTGGFFRSEGFTIDAPANTITSQILSWPYPISVLLVRFNTDSTHIGDTVECRVCPSNPIGTITALVNSGDFTFTVSNTVFSIMKIGFEMKITNGVTTDLLGNINNLNANTNTVTTTISSSNNYEIGSLIFVQVNTIKNYIIGNSSSNTIGKGKIGGSYLPANTPVHAIYNNKSLTTSKIFNYNLEYMY